MIDEVLLFEASIYRFGTDELIEKIHVLSYSLFQADHIVSEMIFNGDEGLYSFPVEIGGISRVRGVNKIINPNFVMEMDEHFSDEGYDGSLPIIATTHLTDEEVMKFDCGQCKDPIQVPLGMVFPYVTCPSCEFKMERKNIKNAGGIYFYAENWEDKK